MSEEDNHEDIEAENPNLDFIKQVVEKETNQIVRSDGDLKGIFTVEAGADDSFNVKIHDGTQDEARVIEDISKEKLIKMMESKL